jgi:hypothetical protein
LDWRSRPADACLAEQEFLGPAARVRKAGFFVFGSEERSGMANHLTPEELSKELGIDRQEVIRVCLEEGVPIYQGKIDKTLFQAQLQAIGAAPSTARTG